MKNKEIRVILNSQDITRVFNMLWFMDKGEFKQGISVDFVAKRSRLVEIALAWVLGYFLISSIIGNNLGIGYDLVVYLIICISDIVTTFIVVFLSRRLMWARNKHKFSEILETVGIKRDYTISIKRFRGMPFLVGDSADKNHMFRFESPIQDKGERLTDVKALVHYEVKNFKVTRVVTLLGGEEDGTKE